MKIRFSIILLLLALFSARAQEYKYNSMAELRAGLNLLGSIKSDELRNSSTQKFWNNLKLQGRIPFVVNDSVAFICRSDSSSVSWAGDFNSWNPGAFGFNGTRAGISNIWYCIKSFPASARLDYKIVEGSKWILDPGNPFVQLSGYGPNSELRMQNWVYPADAVRKESVPRGSVSDYFYLNSYNLLYKVYYRVYTPPGYESLTALPVIYVTDGQEYSDDKLGSMITVLDNLIYSKKIAPVIAVFIDPRSYPDSTGTNRRAEQYTINNSFANFVADELVGRVDSVYKTKRSPDARAILGTSLGGINSAYFGIYRPDTFHLIGINSPAFVYSPAIYGLYENTEKLPLKIHMSTGTINDTQEGARKMKGILESKGYELDYIEVPEGHSWGNWRALLDEMLIYFWGNE